MEWLVDEVLAYLASVGRPVARKTWDGYVSRRQAPAKHKFGSTPLWWKDEVIAWHEGGRAARRIAAGEQQPES